MPAKAIFLDTNGWFALLNDSDELHPAAISSMRTVAAQQRPIVLTDWIVAETGNGLARTAARQRFSEAVWRMLGSSQVRVVFVTPTMMQRSLELYADRPDKTWGLVDCASFVVMSDEGLTDAFTTDRHFEQAGFTCLLPTGGT